MDLKATIEIWEVRPPPQPAPLHMPAPSRRPTSRSPHPPQPGLDAEEQDRPQEDTMTTTAHQLVTEDQRRRIAEAAKRGGRIVVLTGAGISVESGIPPYRGAGGRWTDGGIDAMTRATLAHFYDQPADAWQWHLSRRTEMMAAEPNDAHRAIARLDETFGDRFGLITQNIDRLHQAAGSTPQRTVELHGHMQAMRCSGGCDGTLPIPPYFNGWDDDDAIGDTEMALLTCPRCGCATRPHTLGFDEFYDEVNYRARTAEQWAARASVFVTVGTSGSVPFAPRLATIASRGGALLVDVNPRHNELRQLAAVSGIVVEASAGTGVPAVVDAITAAQAAGI